MATVEETLLALSKEIGLLRKDVKKVRQMMEDPDGEKAKARSQNSAFRKPQQISDELRTFLGLAADELISRSEVTKHMTQYASDNGLKNGKVIGMDEKLQKLLDPPTGTDVTILNLQTFLKRHYIKVAAEPAAAPVPEPEAPKKKIVLKKKV